MTIEAKQEEKKPDGTVDVEKITAGVKSMLADTSKSIVANVLKIVDDKLTGFQAGQQSAQQAAGQQQAKGKPSLSQALQEFKDEIEVMGLDEKQTNALMSFVEKITGKKVDAAKTEVSTQVDANAAFKERKAAAEQLVAAQYPDVLDAASALRKRASEIFNEYTQAKDPIVNSPKFSAVCVKDAAAELGIKPLTVEDIKKGQARSEGGDPQSVEDKSGKPSKNATDFAAGFGVKSDKFAEIFAKKIKGGRGEVIRR